MIVIAVYVAGSIMILQTDFKSKQESIVVSSYRYQNLYSEEHARKLTNEMQVEFEEEKELGMVISLFSVIPLQRKLIEKQNEF